MLRAIVIDDLKRRGGGQSYAKVTGEVLKKMGYDTYFLTNVDYVDERIGKIAYRVGYDFRENSSNFTNFFKIVKLRQQLKRIDIEKFDISINNHPNVFK